MKAFFRLLVRPVLELQTKRFIRRHHIIVVAVTGSVGKTSTRNAIATVLREKYRPLTHPSNYNDTVSVPLAVFDLNTPGSIINVFAWAWRFIQMEVRIWQAPAYNLVVLELGTDKPGEIAHFMKYLKPDVGVVTAVTPEHMEFFGSLDEVAREELALARGAKQLVLSHDDISADYRRRYITKPADTTTYGLASGAQFRAHIHTADPLTGSQIKIDLPDKSHLEATIGVYGEPAVKAAVAAAAVAEKLELNHVEMKAGLAKINPVSGRMVVLRGLNNSLILDDTYNSSPEAVVAALKSLARAETKGRRIAVLGSMNELGSDSPRYHAEVGAEVDGSADILVTIGEMANRHLGPAAIAAGFDSRNFKPAESPYAAGKYLALILQTGDVVLAKGSQNGVFAEEAVKLILADPADVSRLVRQSPGWLARKRAQFGVQ